MTDFDYKSKYLKYKNKYLQLKYGMMYGGFSVKPSERHSLPSSYPKKTRYSTEAIRLSETEKNKLLAEEAQNVLSSTTITGRLTEIPTTITKIISELGCCYKDVADALEKAVLSKKKFLFLYKLKEKYQEMLIRFIEHNMTDKVPSKCREIELDRTILALLKKMVTKINDNIKTIIPVKTIKELDSKYYENIIKTLIQEYMRFIHELYDTLECNRLYFYSLVKHRGACSTGQICCDKTVDHNCTGLFMAQKLTKFNLLFRDLQKNLLDVHVSSDKLNEFVIYLGNKTMEMNKLYGKLETLNSGIKPIDLIINI